MSYQFIPRTSKPLNTNQNDIPLWFANPKNGYFPDYQMPNCTAYSWGRVMEIGLLNNMNIASDGFLGNGGLWGDSGYLGSSWKKGSTPMLGAVGVWSEGTNAGHCAIVEQINSDGTYICSNSGWYRPIDINNWHYFFMTTCTRDNVITYEGSLWTSYSFRYFLYPPYITDTPNPPIPPFFPSSYIKRKFPFVLYRRNIENKRRIWYDKS